VEDSVSEGESSFEDFALFGEHSDGSNPKSLEVDMAIFGSNNALSKIKRDFRNHFTITDLGDLKKIAGLEFVYDRERGFIVLTQKQYILKVLERFGMLEANPVKIRLDPNLKLTKTPNSQKFNIPDYAQGIGSLMWAAINTRPDIAYAAQHHFVREKIISNEIEIFHCASEENISDIFTKALPRPKFKELRNRVGMVSELRGSVEINASGGQLRHA
jgi:hypothetical protein